MAVQNPLDIMSLIQSAPTQEQIEPDRISKIMKELLSPGYTPPPVAPEKASIGQRVLAALADAGSTYASGISSDPNIRPTNATANLQALSEYRAQRENERLQSEARRKNEARRFGLQTELQEERYKRDKTDAKQSAAEAATAAEELRQKKRVEGKDDLADSIAFDAGDVGAKVDDLDLTTREGLAEAGRRIGAARYQRVLAERGQAAAIRDSERIDDAFALANAEFREFKPTLTEMMKGGASEGQIVREFEDILDTVPGLTRYHRALALQKLKAQLLRSRPKDKDGGSKSKPVAPSLLEGLSGYWDDRMSQSEERIDRYRRGDVTR